MSDTPQSLEDLKMITLPSPAWSIQSPGSSDRIIIFKVQDQSSSVQPLVITHSLTIESNFTWKLSVHGHEIQPIMCPAISKMPAHLKAIDLHQFLVLLDKLTICPGHPDHHLISMAKHKKGEFMSQGGDVKAYLDSNAAVELNGQTYSETIRSSRCHLLISSGKCPECVGYRSTLRSMHHKWQKGQKLSTSQATSMHSHTNERWLNSPQLRAKASQLRERVRSTEKKLKYLEEKIKASTEKLAVNVGDSLHNDLQQIMKEHGEKIHNQYEHGTFHRLFWDQQLKASIAHPTQRRWHPMLIRWCLHLRMLSPAAYDALRGVLTLPCGRTLQDYTHCIKAGVGIQVKVTEQLRKEVQMESLEEHQKYVAVVFDEMKIKEGIVYDKNECKIVGFVDLGAVNNTLMSFEQTVNEDTTSVATQILVFMVRGLFIKLSFPYAQYPTHGITADYLFPIAWEVVKHLECADFKVISLTGDKASPNRKFIRMHRLGTVQKSGTTYKIRNPYSVEERYIYFISDVPHLIKTVRNCWSNSFGHSYKRALWVC